MSQGQVPTSRSVVIFRSPVLIQEVKSVDDIMDVLPSGGIFRELQVVHDTGYFPTQGQPSFEEDWHQVRAYYTHGEQVVCSDKRSKNPTSIIMQYVKHSNWRLKYSVKWRTEILKVTIHHFTITLSLSSMRESDESIWIPITHSCEQEMLLPLPLPAHWPPLAPPAWRKQGSHLSHSEQHTTLDWPHSAVPSLAPPLPCRSVSTDSCVHLRGTQGEG